MGRRGRPARPIRHCGEGWPKAGAENGASEAAAQKPLGLSDPRVISDATPDNDWELGEQYAQARPPPRGSGRSLGRVTQRSPV